MSQGTGTLGSKLYMTDTPISILVDTEAEFFSKSYTEIGLIINLGEFGRVFTPVSYMTVAEGRTRKLKAGFDDGSINLVMAQDLSDSGQDLLYTAANMSNQDHYGFRIELNDNQSEIGGPTTYLFRGLPMSFRTQMGALQVIQAMSMIEVNSDILHIPPSNLYDRFINGGSLSAYDLFKGSDEVSAFPVISGNALSLVSADDAAGTFIVNGSQAIVDSGFMLSNGPLVLEAKIKISNPSNVQVYFGVTDQKAGLEIPIESAISSDLVTANATDAVGFMFDTGMAIDNVWLVGVNDDVEETSQNSGLALATDTYKVLRIEIAANGDADFYMDGDHIGFTMTTACRTSVNLYPTICVSSKTTTTRTETVDYLYVRQDV